MKNHIKTISESIDSFDDDDEFGTPERWYVDIPTAECVDNPEASFKNIATFSSREEAVEFCIVHFGADNDGKIHLISGG